MTKEPLSNQVPWSILDGYHSKVEKDKALLAEADATIAKIDTLRGEWQTTLDLISAHIDTCWTTKPVLEKLREDIKAIEDKIQEYVNRTHPLIREKTNVQGEVEERIKEDPMKASEKLKYKVSNFSSLLKDLETMGIPKDKIDQSHYDDYHKITLELNKKRKKLDKAMTELVQIKAKTLDEFNYLRNIRDRDGVPHYKPTYLFWKKAGYYKYRPFLRPENGNPPAQAEVKEKGPDMPALEIPPFKTKHDAITAIQTALNTAEANIRGVDNNLKQLIADFEIAEASDVDEHLEHRGNGKVDMINHEELTKKHDELNRTFIENTQSYFLRKREVSKLKKLEMLNRSNEITVFVSMGYLSRAELSSCYLAYNLALRQLNATLADIERKVKKVSPLLNPLPARLKKLEEAEKDKPEAIKIALKSKKDETPDKSSLSSLDD